MSHMGEGDVRTSMKPLFCDETAGSAGGGVADDSEGVENAPATSGEEAVVVKCGLVGDQSVG